MTRIEQCLDHLVDVMPECPPLWQEVRCGMGYLGVAEVGGVGQQRSVSRAGRREPELDVQLGDHV